MRELAKGGQSHSRSLLTNVHGQDTDDIVQRTQLSRAILANVPCDQDDDRISYSPYQARKSRQLRTIDRRLELGNKELLLGNNAILQELRVMTDKIKDEVLLARYIMTKTVSQGLNTGGRGHLVIRKMVKVLVLQYSPFFRPLHLQ